MNNMDLQTAMEIIAHDREFLLAKVKDSKAPQIAQATADAEKLVLSRLRFLERCKNGSLMGAALGLPGIPSCDCDILDTAQELQAAVSATARRAVR